MNRSPHHRLRLLAGVLLLAFSGLAAAEPPSRVARLGYTSGTVSFSPAGEPDWLQATLNRPLTTGDRLWTDGGARAELQIGGAAIRIGADTDLTLLNLDDRITQLMVSQGTLKLRVRSLAPGQTIEVDTPHLAFTLQRAGDYRIEVDAEQDSTAVMVQSGEGEVFGEGAAYTVRPGRGYRFYGTGLSDYDVLATQSADDLDRWSVERDRRSDRSTSARYVSAEVVGYEELDANGSWRVDANYGNVWTPNRVASGWTPYRDGHWTWVDPWGWTWVDDAPWGFAVSHYGRWAHIRGAWGWVPGPKRERAVYAPALVAFVGGSHFQVTVTVGSTNAPTVGWFPLAPREVYRPAYPVSRGYFDNINRSNAVIAPTIINNVYNTTIVNNTTTIVNPRYANQQVLGAVVAVPTQAFVQSQPVAKATVRLPPEVVRGAPVGLLAAVAPVAQSLHGGARDASARPPARTRPVVVRTAPPAPVLPFAAQLKQLAASPGRPIDDQQRKRIEPAAAAPAAAKVNVVTAVEAPKPTALPPATAPAGRTADARKAAAARPEAAGRATRKPDEGRPADVKVEAPAAQPAATDAAKAETAKAEATRAAAAETTRAAAAAKADAEHKAADAKATAAAADADRAAKAGTARTEAARAEADKAEAAKAEAAKAARTSADAARNDERKSREARTEAIKAERARAAADNAATGKAAEARANEARAAETKATGARADAAAAAQANAVKAEAAKAAAAKADSAKADAARATRDERASADAARAEAAKARAARSEAANAARAKAAADRADEPKPTRDAKDDPPKAAPARAPRDEPAGARPSRAPASAAKAEPENKGRDEKRPGTEEPPRRP